MWLGSLARRSGVEARSEFISWLVGVLVHQREDVLGRLEPLLTFATGPERVRSRQGVQKPTDERIQVVPTSTAACWLEFLWGGCGLMALVPEDWFNEAILAKKT